MGFLNKIEAAMKLGVSVELIDYFTQYSPKPGENTKLIAIKTELGEMYDKANLIVFNNYLNSPWPLTKEGNRPPIPGPIKEDIKRESHYSCAICGFMDNGEVAHIEAVAKTQNNGPENLIFLCPNHHTKYDYGYKLNSNITIEEVRAAKLIKRNSRLRILKYEANATKYLLRIIKFLKQLDDKLKNENNQNLIAIYLTEMRELTQLIPELAEKSHDQSAKDEFATETEKILSEKAPELTKFANNEAIKNSEKNLRSAVGSIVSHTSKIIIDIDEVDCPHCGGSGQTGLVGDLCAYCGGSCVVSQEKHDEYDPDEIDEVPCPRCGGSGRTGLVGDLCAYCGGSCVVSQEKHDEYDPDEIDEVPCPHCGGSGRTGLVGDLCAYCGGSCVVSQEKHDEYDPDEIDEVPCPRCGGSGRTGLVGDLCAYCGGSCVVSQEKHDEYDPDEIDEVPCPRCGGSGQTGLVGDLCAYCGGSCVVSQEKHDEYDPDEIDEVPCPHCGGSGQTGRVGNVCKLCKGSCVVSHEVETAYGEQYRK